MRSRPTRPRQVPAVDFGHRPGPRLCPISNRASIACFVPELGDPSVSWQHLFQQCSGGVLRCKNVETFKAPAARGTCPDQLTWSVRSLVAVQWALLPLIAMKMSHLRWTSHVAAYRCRSLCRCCGRALHHGWSSNMAPEHFVTSAPTLYLPRE